MENVLDLALHPIRIRILMALAGREMTAQQVAETLEDVPPATLYRHLSRLVEAKVLTVVAERRVRGTLEKVYTLTTQGAQMSPEEFAALSRQDHLRYFTTFVASLLDDYSRYVKNAEPFNVLADGVGYRKFPLELSDAEFAAAAKAVNNALLPYLQNKAAPGRKRRIFSIIVMPELTAAVRPSKDKPAVGTSGTHKNKIKETK